MDKKLRRNPRKENPEYLTKPSISKHKSESQAVNQQRSKKQKEYDDAKSLAIQKKEEQDRIKREKLDLKHEQELANFNDSCIDRWGNYKPRKCTKGHSKIDLELLAYYAANGWSVRWLANQFDVSESMLANMPYTQIIKLAANNRLNSTMTSLHDAGKKGSAAHTKLWLEQLDKRRVLDQSENMSIKSFAITFVGGTHRDRETYKDQDED